MAYGATKKLFEVCGAQAEYTVPQAFEKDAEIPKTAAGEDLGVGEGWWYNGLSPTGSQYGFFFFFFFFGR